MGKNFRGGRGRGGGRGGGGRGAPRSDTWNNTRTDAAVIDKHNDSFEKYYNELAIVPDNEKEEFWAALRRELPNSFRFCGSKGHALAVQQRLVDHYVPEITSVKYNGETVEPPRPVEWFPEKLAWAMTTPKNVIRKFPPFSSFQKFLVSETSVGNISRQEIVSMIPPLLMDIKPGMTVLDLCAAPGSKSAQLIEMVHRGEEARIRHVLQQIGRGDGREVTPGGIETLDKEQALNEGDWSDDGRSTGLLIANDVDYRRAQMLVHQVKRLNSPNLIVTNHDATQFPSIRIPSTGPTAKYLKFDRILADVPCSGDGTTRKNPNIWKDWIPGNGLGLYIMQVRILVRALQMLKVGGRVVYSTCSLNPVENEAVIATAIDRCGGLEKVNVIDCSKELPGLRRAPGLKQWKVMDKQGRIWSSWKDVETAMAEAESEEGFARLQEGMFPPEMADGEETIPYERCIRVYPHYQDTGGFFITVLEKRSEIKARPESAPKPKPEWKSAQRSAASSAPGSPKKRAFDEDISPTAKKVKVDEPVKEEAVETQADVKMEEEATGGPVQEAPSAATPMDGVETPVVKNEPADIPIKSEPADFPVKKKNNQMHEEPYKYLDPEHPELQRIYAFYEISPRFPRDRFMVRNATGEPVKAVYYTSTLARDILVMNEGKGMKFVQCGVKMFMKQDSQGHDICRWRIQSEGMPIIEPWVGEGRVVRLTKRPTLRKLLIEMFPKMSGEGWKKMGEIAERVRDISMGCCVLRVEPSDDEDGFQERIVLPLWRGISSLNLMLPKEERKAMLLRLYNDDSPLIDHSRGGDNNNNNNQGNAAPTPVLTPAPGSLTTQVDALIETAAAEAAGDQAEPIAPSLAADIRPGDNITAIVTEDQDIEAESRLRGEDQARRDAIHEMAPGVTDEEDVFNKTV
ncbi:S-adenosyl-L-methionine-dependent methyltransferase [Trichodelitschia bisporula]|uniref:S-adenosyl-L-methionine-dependent methyltransferase n=1 Tax=Trichodelitschia bisporula TaxID=703511 RepID=A0A6G1I6V1_9PEZI|nr:S-adenosyl-L-methionine-dependent methyltransferase [Trichodelitschia bisporula]